MSFLGSKLKRYDMHMKVVEGVSQKTSLGAVLTLCCVALCLLLSFSEMKHLLRSERSTHVVLDQISSADTVKLHFDVEFNRIQCANISFTQEVVRGTVHQFLDSDDSLVLEDVGSGCRVKGHVLTDKVAGNFKFQVSAKQRDTNNLVIASQASFYPNLDLSHVVHNIYFEGKNDVVSQLLGGLVSPNTPLKNQVTSLASDVGLYHYGLQIVPAVKKKNGKVRAANLNEYSVTERKVQLNDLSRGMSIGGSIVQNFVGVMITYDFYPVAVVTELTSQGIMQFIVSLCVIIGGLVTVMGLIDRCLNRSVKAIIGKKD